MLGTGTAQEQDPAVFVRACWFVSVWCARVCVCGVEFQMQKNDMHADYHNTKTTVAVKHQTEAFRV